MQSPDIIIDDLSTKIEFLVDMISQLGSSYDLAERMQSTLHIHQLPLSESLLSTAQKVALEANVDRLPVALSAWTHERKLSCG